MGLFDNVKKIFSNKEEKEEARLIGEQPLKRTNEYLIQYEKWLRSDEHRQMLQLLADSFKAKNNEGGQKDHAVCFLMIPSVNGMTYSFDSNRWAEEEFIYLFDYMCQKLEELGYSCQSSKVESWDRDEYQENVQRCQMVNKEDRFDKVLLRLTFKNDKMYSLKCCACSPPEKSATSNKRFQQIIQEITNYSS